MKAGRKGGFLKPVTTGTWLAGGLWESVQRTQLWNYPSQTVTEQRPLCPSAYQPFVEGCSREAVSPQNFPPFGIWGGIVGEGPIISAILVMPNGQSL